MNPCVMTGALIVGSYAAFFCFVYFSVCRFLEDTGP